MSEELLTIERPIGEIVFPFNYEVQKQTPLDRRTLASSIEELTDPDFPYYYRGIMVAMFGATPSADDGIYTLEGADHTNIDNWVKTSTIKTSTKVLAGDAIRIEDVEENGIISKKIHVEIGEGLTSDSNGVKLNYGETIVLEDSKVEVKHNNTLKRSTDSVTKGQLSVNHGNTISTNASTGTLDVKHDKVSIDAMEDGTLYVHTIDGGTF